MPIFCQFFYKLVLVWCQFDMVEVKGGRLVPIGHHIATGQTSSDSDTHKRSCRKLVYTARNIFVAIRLWQLDLLEILLCFLITHTNMATQRQESPVEQQGHRHQQLCPRTQNLSCDPHISQTKTSQDYNYKLT